VDRKEGLPKLLGRYWQSGFDSCRAGKDLNGEEKKALLNLRKGISIWSELDLSSLPPEICDKPFEKSGSEL
jgi:hypothetical protein